MAPACNTLMQLAATSITRLCHWWVGTGGAHCWVIKKMMTNNKSTIVHHLIATSLLVTWHLDSVSKKASGDGNGLTHLVCMMNDESVVVCHLVVMSLLAMCTWISCQGMQGGIGIG